MKILHISKYFPPIYGGIENQAKYICDYLSKKKESVQVLAFGKKTGIRLNKYKIYEFKPLINLMSQPISLRFIFSAKKIIQNNDIIHFHYPNVIGLITCFLFATNKILYVHWHSDIVKQRYLNFLFLIVEKKILNNAKRIIFTSKIYANQFKYYNLYKHKIVTINCGTHDLSKDFNRNKVIKKNYLKLQNKYKKFNIIYSIGRLVKYKGFKYLIEASKDLDQNTRVIIAGDGQEFKSLSKIILENNLEKKVFLLKEISHHDHLSYLKLCKVFCLPSIDRSEAFGIVLIEAMTFSKPIISTKIKGSGINWVNVDQITGFKVPIKDPKKLSFNLTKIIKDKNNYKKMSINSKKRYQKFFTSNLMNKNFYKLYKSDYEANRK